MILTSFFKISWNFCNVSEKTGKKTYSAPLMTWHVDVNIFKGKLQTSITVQWVVWLSFKTIRFSGFSSTQCWQCLHCYIMTVSGENDSLLCSVALRLRPTREIIFSKLTFTIKLYIVAPQNRFSFILKFLCHRWSTSVDIYSKISESIKNMLG